MSLNNESVVHRVRDGPRGQTFVLIPVVLVALLAAAAFAIDMGNLYVCREELQAATQAAALAGATAILNPNLSATTVATQYSAVTGNFNAHSNLRNVSVVSTQLTCLTTSGLPACFPPASALSSAPVNAIIVEEQAQVATFFAKAFGVTSLTITATATACTAGGLYGTYKPYNIVFVLDTTESMNTNDADCGNITQEQCALGGIRTLLSELDPCPTNLASCPSATNGNVPNPVDQFGLMAFPGLCGAALSAGSCPSASTLTTPPAGGPTAVNDYNCLGANPSITSYNNNPAYLVLPLQSDYRTVDTKAALNASSDIVIAAGGGSCQGVQAPGGQGTFYAGAITAAQNYLTNLTTNPRANTVQDVMILLSDGDATATATKGMVGTVPVAATGVPYPAMNECNQAVSAATAAKNAGILIYSVSYGSETTGCNTVPESPALTPCQTMQDIASLPNGTPGNTPSQYFFSQATSGGAVVCAGARPSSSLSQAFQEIAGDLTTARLIPNGTK